MTIHVLEKISLGERDETMASFMLFPLLAGCFIGHLIVVSVVDEILCQ